MSEMEKVLNMAIDAEKIPSGQITMAGEGSAQIGVEVSRFKQKELDKLTEEALADAIRQAVDKSIKKLSPPSKRKIRKRRKGKKR